MSWIVWYAVLLIISYYIVRQDKLLVQFPKKIIIDLINE